MKPTAETPGSLHPCRKFLKISAAICLAAIWLAAIPAWQPEPAYSQASGLRIQVASGYPEQLPADNHSQTLLELDLDSCNFGVAVDPQGTISLSISTSLGIIDPPFATSMDGGEFPPSLTLTAGSTPGQAVVEVIASYCPAGAVVLMGVCVDQAYQDATCTGNTTLDFVPPQNTAEESPPPAADQAEEFQPDLPGPELDQELELAQDASQPEDSLAALYQDLEEFLAGEGISAPSPEAMAASGIALTTLLAGWLVLNQLSGISAERSLEAIQAWQRGEVPPEDSPQPFVGAEVKELPREPAELDEQGPGDQTPTSQKKDLRESAEDRLLRGVQDAQDLDDAFKQTRKDFEAFESRVPPAVKNSEAWKKHVQPRIKQVKKLMKKGELDQGRTWLDRTEQLVKLRQDVDRDLGYLPDDKREAIVWTERTLKTLGHFASDTYQTLVVDPAKAAGEKILPGEQAQKWNKAMDELNQELSNVAQGIGELPRKGAKLYTHGNLQEQAPKIHQELYGEREVPVEYPDFMGKGTRKVRELWDHTMRCLFHDR